MNIIQILKNKFLKNINVKKLSIPGDCDAIKIMLLPSDAPRFIDKVRELEIDLRSLLDLAPLDVEVISVFCNKLVFKVLQPFKYNGL
ncbi:hypothetical protein HQQ94_00200 [Shewanella sp. VB17]|uniref:hypothetical protein n=1 Tax=Shewanella sp. VB17 TaxID=2739432 RepID=UPI00156598FC|nr:hypothetical protein [Shewanella sp. VB17]NRD71695.1 hypothetical protein [Shewanella sp. VB17]